ncbi:hypothetical protein [Caproiciproducens sp. MSJ-32]|nr:hypothetical protein [Caproiciproducens sp. MSJ-32]
MLLLNHMEMGKTYLAPIFYSPTGLWYDAAQFEKEKLPTTWDEM